MTNLNEAANMDWNDDMVCSNKTVGGGRTVNWAASVIQHVRDFLNVDLDEWVTTEGEDEVYFPTGGCCGF